MKWFPQHRRFLNHTMSVAQLVELKGEVVSPTLMMKKATSVKVTVTDPEGNPLPDAEVSMWPNQIWFDGGTQILGMSFRTSQWLVDARSGKKREFGDEAWKKFYAKTDDNGVAVLGRLPTNVTESLNVGHKDYEMPAVGNERVVEVNLELDVVAKVAVQMQVKGTKVLGEDEGLEDRDVGKEGQQ